MAWDVSDDPVDFDEAVVWFRKRVRMTRADFDRLTATAKRKAFFVSHVAQLSVVHDAWKAVDAAVANGTSFDDFKKTIGSTLRSAWSGTVEDPAWRLETIFRTNVQNAYGAGRYRQAKHPDVVSDRPVWMFDAILDGRTTRVCKACDGTKLANDSPWWATHTPPLHFSCRSSFITLPETVAGKLTQKPSVEGPDKGFGSPPGEGEWEPDFTQTPPPLKTIFVAKTKAPPPPPPASKLVEGVHIEKLVSSMSKSTNEALLGSISDAETLKFLERRPLAQLRLKSQSKLGGKEPNGWYHPLTFQLEVTAARKPSTFGQSWQPGISWSVSTATSTPEAAARATLRHELGHHVHLHEGRGTTVDKIVVNAYARATAANRFITQYAADDPDEYFAESYAAYYHRRSSLKAHDPNGYKMVEDVLKERGMLP